MMSFRVLRSSIRGAKTPLNALSTQMRHVHSKSTQRNTLKVIRPLQASFFPGFLITLAGTGAAGLLTYYLLDARSAVHEYVFCPLIRMATDAETGHRLGVKLLEYGLAPRLWQETTSEALKVNVFGKTLNNPIGCAAGLDKDGEAIDGLFNCGFGYVEIGSITPEPQPGNPKPRFFRLPKDNAVINRYGFNSTGHLNVVARLRLRLEHFIRKNAVCPENNSLRDGKLLGINLGKNKLGDEVEDYVKGVQRLGPYADVLVINVSSPNTPGLRSLQQEDKLAHLLETVVSERNKLKGHMVLPSKNKSGAVPPVCVKIAPDLSENEISAIAKAVKQSGVDGVIVSNTTIERPIERMRTKDGVVNETGGLSGPPVKQLSLKALRTLSRTLKQEGATNVTLIGCGGIANGADAIEFARAGASFVELYTSFAYRGPGLVYKINKQIEAELKKQNTTWMDIVGADLK